MAKRADIAHGVVLWLLGLAAAGAIATVLWRGADFYLTPLADRPHHADFREFRPAGRTGHGLGVVGSAMVLLLLLYSLRKRWRRLGRAGRLGIWLRYHIFLGVTGPILITLHTSFKVEGLVAVSYWSMVLVALSGVLGRYLYQQIPRNVLGEALSPQAIEQRNETVLVEIVERWRVDQRGTDALDRLALGDMAGRSAIAGILGLPVRNLILARRLRRWARDQGLPDDRELRRLASQWVLTARRLHLFHRIRDLFHWWHVLHKPMAAIMIAVMIVHVVVALALGYTWVFGAEG